MAATANPAGLSAALTSARCQTDSLFALLGPDAAYVRPIAERHRFIFYIGHLEAFDWNLLWRKTLRRASFDPALDQLFEFGIDPPEGSLPSDTPEDWPTLDQTYAYNRRVREALDAALPDLPETELRVAIEHRLMHAETLAYMFHQLDHRHKFRAAPEHETIPGTAKQGMVAIPAGRATLGRPRGSGFGWDNEFPEIKVEVPEFSIQRCKVSNGEYLEFVEAGGPVPPFWRREGETWLCRGMFEDVPLPLNAAVYCTQDQASAYAAWRGMALPTEAQYHRAAYGTPDGYERLQPWGDAAPDETRGNFDFLHWDPVAVSAYPAGDSAFGVAQLAGNGWEWTSTVFEPFPGFEPFPFYPGYSANFFDGSHYVLKGAGPRTSAALVRRTFRNWFRARYPYVHAGFRCVENI